MAIRVQEIMNRELFSVLPDEPVGHVLGDLLALGITGAPVVDDDGVALGVVSLRDLVGDPATGTAGERMTLPAVTIGPQATIAEAGRLLADRNLHRLVVIDEAGHAIGAVSSLDVVRGLLGMPAPHPAAFPHLDAGTGLSWTDDTPLTMARVDAAPDGPGLFVIIEGGRGVSEAAVWGEATHNVRTRLIDVLELPQDHSPRLARLIERADLRFRAAATSDLTLARRVVDRVLGERGLVVRVAPRGPAGRSSP